MGTLISIASCIPRTHGEKKPAKPIAMAVPWEWQSVLEESLGTKFESMFHTLCYHNQMDNVSDRKD